MWGISYTLQRYLKTWGTNKGGSGGIIIFHLCFINKLTKKRLFQLQNWVLIRQCGHCGQPGGLATNDVCIAPRLSWMYYNELLWTTNHKYDSSIEALWAMTTCHLVSVWWSAMKESANEMCLREVQSSFIVGHYYNIQYCSMCCIW